MQCCRHGNSRYYISGKPVSISTSRFQTADTDKLREEIDKYRRNNPSDYFKENIKLFIKANEYRLHDIKEEGSIFIKELVSGFSEEQIVLSFSGGKDSTVTADLVAKSLGNPSLMHIFGDTTLKKYVISITD